MAGAACGTAVPQCWAAPAMAQGEQLFTLLIPTPLSVVSWHDPDTSIIPLSCPHQGCDTPGSSRSHHLLRQQVVGSSRVFSTPLSEFVEVFVRRICAILFRLMQHSLVLSRCLLSSLSQLLGSPRAEAQTQFLAGFCGAQAGLSLTHPCGCVCEGAASHAPFQSLNKPKKVLDSSKFTRAILETLTCKLSIFLSLKRAPR